MKRILILGAIVLLVTSCATGVDSGACISTGESVGGFWWGVWNGMAAGFAFIGSLFDDTIAIYDVNNKGGFIIRDLFGNNKNFTKINYDKINDESLYTKVV